MIKLNIVGKILKGLYEGWYILVEPSYGGYTVFVSTSKTNIGNVGYDVEIKDGEGYDDWVLDYGSLEFIFARREWIIDWEVQ